VHTWWRDAAAAGRLLRDGTVDLAQLPASTVAALGRAGAPVEGVVPREGTTGRIESWLIGARAPHPVCAYRFLDWVGSPAAQALVADVGGRSPVSARSCDVLGRSRCRALHVGEDAYLDAVRFVRAPEEPTDLREWEATWTAVRAGR
jgi:putative spermidine/putrescine transport system substrate-binding protein